MGKETEEGKAEAQIIYIYLRKVTPLVATTDINGGPKFKSNWNSEVLVFLWRKENRKTRGKKPSK